MIADILSIIQGETPEEANEIAKTLEGLPASDLPGLINLVKGANYYKAGNLEEAEHSLLAVYEDDTGGIRYWELVNDLRITHHKDLSGRRTRILSNVRGGRIGLALMANCDVVSFIPGQGLGLQGAATITYRPIEDSFMDILGHLPREWEPDYVLFFLSEIYPLPAGIEHSPFPVIGLPGDPWKINKLSLDLQFFDALMPAMKHMCPVYQRIGESKVFYRTCSGTQGYVPWAFRDLADVGTEKGYDVVATGAVSNPFYRKRERYLWRLLSLADRYRIFVGRTPTLTECYRLMAQAKIVIHCPSIQGGVNLRPFEAVACGALLFHEEGDRSIQEFFEPGREIVLFNEDNFEEKIQYYLARDKEREEMVLRAMERNRNNGNIKANMKGVAEKIRAEEVTVSKRAAVQWSEPDKLNALGISSFYAKDFQQAATLFARAIQRNGNSGKFYNNLAVCLMVEAVLGERPRGITRNLLLKANNENPPSAVSMFNLLSFLGYIEPDRQEFFRLGDQVVNDLCQRPHIFQRFCGDEIFFYLEQPVEGFPDSLIFRMELEFLLMGHPDRGPEYQKKFLEILLWRTLEYVGDHCTKAARLGDGIKAYSEALKYCPENESILERLADLYEQTGLLSEAENVLHTLLVLSPLNEKAHLALSRVEAALGKEEELKERVSRLLHFNGLKQRARFEEVFHQGKSMHG